MSGFFIRIQVLAVAVVLSAGALLAGCSGDMGDPGADRTQQQSEQLQNRIKTTQIDR